MCYFEGYINISIGFQHDNTRKKSNAINNSITILKTISGIE